MEQTELLITTFVFLTGLALAWFIGKMGDPVFRCNKMRQLLRRPYVVLKITNKDNQLINTYVVNAEKDILTVGTDMWVITKGSVYLQTKQGKKKESGFKMNLAELKREEGAPTVYVDRDSIKTIGFYERKETDSVKPTEVGSTLLAWVFNQYAKKLAGVEQQKIFIILILIGIVITAAISFDTNQKANEAIAEVKALSGGGVVTLPAGTVVKDGAVQIVQPGGSGG